MCCFDFPFRRPALEDSVTQHGPRLPKLEKFRWRVDVAISTRYSNHVHYRPKVM